jgi:hypothetical protein
MRSCMPMFVKVELLVSRVAVRPAPGWIGIQDNQRTSTAYLGSSTPPARIHSNLFAELQQRLRDTFVSYKLFSQLIAA